MKKTSTDHVFLPDKDDAHVVCGVTVVDWNEVVVYVHPKTAPYGTPTHLHFTFFGSGDYRLDEVVRWVDQWTYYVGHVVHPIRPQSHEFYRAKEVATKAVATFRRNYLARCGMEPMSLLQTTHLDRRLLNKKTSEVNNKKRGT